VYGAEPMQGNALIRLVGMYSPEAALYATVATELTELGFAIVTHDIGTQTQGEVAQTLATAILTRLDDHAGAESVNVNEAPSRGSY
jgi:hypothetical protein